jgi:hypothetical protein
MKWFFWLGLALASCSPAVISKFTFDFPLKSGEVWNVVFNAPKEISFDFSVDTNPRLDKSNWVYSSFKTSAPALTGSGVVPNDRKNLVLVFQLSNTEHLSCVVPLSDGFAKGIGAQYQNDRKTASFGCAISKK